VADTRDLDPDDNFPRDNTNNEQRFDENQHPGTGASRPLTKLSDSSLRCRTRNYSSIVQYSSQIFWFRLDPAATHHAIVWRHQALPWRPQAVQSTDDVLGFTHTRVTRRCRVIVPCIRTNEFTVELRAPAADITAGKITT
jgi:hypothetical protein